MIKYVELKLESYGISKFLYFEAGSKEEIDAGQVEQLRGSRIPGVLPCAALLEGDCCYLRYDLISDVTLEYWNSTTATKEKLYSSFLNIAETLADAEQNGLDPANFVFSQQQIFIDNFSNRLVFIYLPLKNNVFEKVSLKDFLKELLYSAPYDGNGDPSFFVKFHNYLAEAGEITPAGLLEKLNEIAAESDSLLMKPTKLPEQLFKTESGLPESEPKAETATPAIQPHFYSPGSEIHNVKTSLENGVLTSEYSSQKKDVKTGRKLEIEEEVNYKRITRAEVDENNSLLKDAASLGATAINIQPALSHHKQDEENEGTTVLGVFPDDEEEGTTTLGHTTPRPFLLAVGRNEKITIAKDFFKIGRDPMRADFASDNKVIGRVHAHLISNDGEYYFEDNHSTNGSFVNGVKVSPKERIKIKHEDRIKLANEEFIFRLY
ncbi:FHA domain-containing protein [Bacillus sp. REN3]|uniref:FHA domain-containing protein n=1 Tax=Bacillus sp. REN3 TaxID=2802440 RepID=UPI001AEDB6D5|nr:FHA domain-containing protein [Bacillus sp. REN3]